MRTFKKYKPLLKLKSLIKSCVTPRTLRFKRSKWLLIQSQRKNLDNLKKSSFFLNSASLHVSSKHFTRIKNSYREGLLLKNSITCFFDKALSTYDFKSLILKRFLTYEDLFISCLIIPFFKLDVFLWKLGLFPSSYAVTQNLIQGNICINGSIVKLASTLATGTVISFQNLRLNSDYRMAELLSSFIEVDLYTKTIVLIKDYTTLSVEDIILVIREHLNISVFLNYVQKA
jgi:ribosomal 50S subunit-recycling heat shock protein